MCCLLASLFMFGPRAAIVVWALIEPARWSASFDTVLWPIVGFLLLPWMTLMFVAVAPGAAHGSAKRWPAESFGALCRQLARALGQPCVLVGSARERALGAAVRRHAGRGDLVDLTGRTDLASLIGVLARARLMIGNDSGTAHVAASLGRPAIALFGSTSTRHSGPVGPRTRILSRSLPCSPCFERDCPLGHLDCLRGLAPETVVQAAGDALRGVPA